MAHLPTEFGFSAVLSVSSISSAAAVAKLMQPQPVHQWPGSITTWPLQSARPPGARLANLRIESMRGAPVAAPATLESLMASAKPKGSGSDEGSVAE